MTKCCGEGWGSVLKAQEQQLFLTEVRCCCGNAFISQYHITEKLVFSPGPKPLSSAQLPSSSSTEWLMPGMNLKICWRMLPLRDFLGRVPNRDDARLASQVGEDESLLLMLLL